ncbi:MAG: hypothetical protein AB7K52_07540 [Phycisphaerales bacterium]
MHSHELKNPAARPPRPLVDDPAHVGWLPAITRALDEQIQLAESLREHSRRQAEFVAAKDFESVAGVLDDRQPIVDRLQELSVALAPLAGGMGEIWPALTPAQRDLLTSRVDQLSRLLDDVGAQDDLDRSGLETHRRALGDELAGVDRGRSALGAYTDASVPADEPRFQDREG